MATITKCQGQLACDARGGWCSIGGSPDWAIMPPSVCPHRRPSANCPVWRWPVCHTAPPAYGPVMDLRVSLALSGLWEAITHSFWEAAKEGNPNTKKKRCETRIFSVSGLIFGVCACRREGRQPIAFRGCWWS